MRTVGTAGLMHQDGVISGQIINNVGNDKQVNDKQATEFASSRKEPREVSRGNKSSISSKFPFIFQGLET